MWNLYTINLHFYKTSLLAAILIWFTLGLTELLTYYRLEKYQKHKNSINLQLHSATGIKKINVLFHNALNTFHLCL